MATEEHKPDLAAPDTSTPPVYSAKARIGSVQRALPTVTTIEEFGKAIGPYVSSMAEHTSATSVLVDTLYRTIREFQDAAYGEVTRVRQKGDKLESVSQALQVAADRFRDTGAQFWIEARRDLQRLFVAVIVCTGLILLCEGTRIWIDWTVLDKTKVVLANQGVLFERLKAIEAKGTNQQARPSRNGN
jgi:hypothetical protein